MEAMQKLFKELEDLAEDPKHEEAMDTDVRERAAAYLDQGIIRIMNVLDNQPVSEEAELDEAEYQGKKVTLNKPIRTGKDEPKKFKVYVKDGDKVKMVRFGHQGKGNEKTMTIKKSDPERRKSFRARHNCDNPGPKTKARYWSCKAW